MMDPQFNRNFVPMVSDELERLILQEIAHRGRANADSEVLDLPCGEGHHAVAMAKLGARVLAADQSSRETTVRGRALASAVGDRVDFAAAGLREGPLPAGPFDLVFCHHGIYRLAYPEARRVVRALLKSLRIGGKLFISAYGLHSALGEGYADAEKAVEERHSCLTPALASAYNITEPVCLYTERNLVTLLFEAGGSVLKTFTTTHGTVKGVAVRL
ncbi:MAG: class I SAM-dependent methyltransferase [Azovibrio sp.]|uniref:class I SAM-dependent methyltransferase n=1 Tax=Azovibrio sp. TaxID=1872673 RepID=UPI003C72C46A